MSGDPPDPPLLTVTHDLSGDQLQAVEDLVQAATLADGVPPVREQALLQMRAGQMRGGGTGTLLHAHDPGPGRALLGFGHIDDPAQADGPAVEIAVHPEARNRGVGTALLDRALAHCPPAPSPVRLWAHGQNAAAGQLARARGFVRVRHLYQLRRSLFAPLPPVLLPPGVTLRRVDPDHDVAALQALNAAAFTALPDQASWTAADIRARFAEVWFDPAGLLIAESGVQMVGFHWTKGARPMTGSGEAGDLGEVYVVGVHPDARGSGLGRALTLAGLHHLRAAGASGALLYVDATNAPAIALYTSLGFSVWDSDMLFRR